MTFYFYFLLYSNVDRGKKTLLNEEETDRWIGTLQIKIYYATSHISMLSTTCQFPVQSAIKKQT